MVWLMPPRSSTEVRCGLTADVSRAARLMPNVGRTERGADMRRTILAVAVALFTTASVMAADSVWVAGVEFRKGMEEVKIREQLPSSYKIVPGPHSNFIIVAKQSQKTVGSFVLDSTGRLAAVNKEWGSFAGTDAVAMAEALASVLRDTAARGKATIVVRPAIREPGLQIEIVEIRLPLKTVVITIQEGRETTRSASVSEVFRLKD